MYDDIVDIYQQIFPLNQEFVEFLTPRLRSFPQCILDLGCGPGDYVDHFTHLGHRAVGIDNSQGMISWAKEHNAGIFYQLALSEIGSLREKFDCIYCIGNSLSYLPHKDTPVFLKNIHNLLNDGGIFILQMVNWDRHMIQKKLDFPVHTLQDGIEFHRAYETLSDGNVRFVTKLTKGGNQLQHWEATLYPRLTKSFSNILNKAGFSISSIYGDFKYSPFHPATSPAMIFDIQKG